MILRTIQKNGHVTILNIELWLPSNQETIIFFQERTELRLQIQSVLLILTQTSILNRPVRAQTASHIFLRESDRIQLLMQLLTM